MEGLNYNISFSTNASSVLPKIENGLDAIDSSTSKVTKSLGDCFKTLLSFELVANSLSQVEQSFNNILAPGIQLNTQMADLAAITGLTGQGLKDIEKAARDSAKVFGTEATQNIESYKLLLSQLSPEIANSSEAMKLMGDNVNILSKTMGGDTVAATNVLTTVMNQYGVSLDDPIAASHTMAEMMNVMAAAAKEGSAELPQIQSAMEQVGMVAKTVGLSFVETNAAIQMLDKAGKKGSEGGVALRNVLSTLSQGQYAPKDATEGLNAAGISVDKLADASIPLTERLRMLSPVMNDTALMGKVFGKENMAAAIALIQSADAQDELAQKITGTNTALEQANVVMGSYQERMNRASAVMNDLKIGFFNLTASFSPYLQGMFSAVSSLGQMAAAGNALYSIYESKLIPNSIQWIKEVFKSNVALIFNTNATNQNVSSKIRASISASILTAQTKSVNAQMMIGAIVSRIQSAGIRSVATSFGIATLGAMGFKIALNALGIGLVVSAVVALVAVVKHLWDNSKQFREVLFGTWEAAKAVFNNIGVFFKRLWDMVIKPILNLYWTLFKAVWGGIWDFIKFVFNGIASVFVWLYDTAVSIFTNVYEFISGVFTWLVDVISQALSYIGSFFGGLWDWFSGLFSGFISLINTYLIEPLMEAFSGVWDWIVELFSKIMEKLSAVFEPIKKFFSKLFSDEGMTNVSVAYEQGAKKGAESFEKDQAAKKQSKESKDNPLGVGLSGFDNTKGFQGIAPTPPISGVGAKDKKEGGSGGGGGRALTIGKLVETLNVHYHTGVKESASNLKQVITETLLTAVNDVNLAN